MSFSFGFANAEGSLGLSVGINSAATGTLLKPWTKIPLGSTAKLWTALSIMQAVEAGSIDLGDSASAWVDPVLVNMANLTLIGMWGNKALTITIRHLLSMRAGFHDY